MTCDDIRDALDALLRCVETDQGSCVTTHCLYPSFDPVSVYVVRYGEGYKIHDGAGAMRSAWDHGRDAPLVRRMLTRQAVAHHLKITDDSLVAEVPSKEWLASAILAVANASSLAAHAAVERIVIAAEEALKDRIFRVLTETVPAPKAIQKAYEFPGLSGKRHSFDFAVQRDHDGWLVLDAVVKHHVSISSRYVAFADTKAPESSIIGRFAVYDRPLEPDDAALLQQVADLVPFTSLRDGVKREMAIG